MKIKMHFEAWREVLGTYRQKWASAWQIRHQMDGHQRTSAEAEFLPASLAVQETPASPTKLITMRVIALGLILGLLASIYFKLDIIVSAEGLIIPTERVQEIQVLEPSVIKKIHVKDGQRVESGDVLIELFTPGVDTEVRKLQAEREVLLQEVRALQSMKQMMGAESSPHQALLINSDAGNTLFRSRLSEYKHKLERAAEEVRHRDEEIRSLSSQLNKIRNILPHVSVKATDYAQLQTEGYVSRHASADQQRQLEEVKSEILISEGKIREAQALQRLASEQFQQLKAEAWRTVLEQSRDVEIKLHSIEQELAKSEAREALMTLRAPVAGEVSHLAVHTVGGVIPSAQTVMRIVPANSRLEIEAMTQNKDIGFILKGQEAQIKVETFPFTKYGVLPGLVDSISATSEPGNPRDKTEPSSEAGGAANYRLRVQIPETALAQQKYPSPLKPGMRVTVEVNIGQRRAIEYLLSPLSTALKEAAREL
jgi:hemolysin D